MDFKEEIAGIAKAQAELAEKRKNLESVINTEFENDVEEINSRHETKLLYKFDLLVNENFPAFAKRAGKRCGIMLYISRMMRSGMHFLTESERAAALPEFKEDFRKLGEKYPLEVYHKKDESDLSGIPIYDLIEF